MRKTLLPAALLLTACSSHGGSEASGNNAAAIQPGALLLGVDLNGPAVTIDGVAWQSEADAKNRGFSMDAAFPCTVVPTVTTPAADADTMTMLAGCYWNSRTTDLVFHQQMPAGTYDVYLWSREDHSANYRAMDVALEGRPAATGVGDMPYGQWQKYGPYTTLVGDGTLDIDVHATKGDPTIAGIAIYASPNACPGGGGGGGIDAGGGGGGGAGASGDGGSTTDAGGPQDSPWVPSGYDRVFADEFDAPSLDTSKWWTRYVYNGGTLDFLNDEVERYREQNNHVMTGSTMKLTAYAPGDARSANLGAGLYASGMVRSKVTAKYGYFETRVKMPAGLGAWPAFWLTAEAPSWPPEIDIFEFVNNGVEDKTNMLHTGVIDHGAQGSAFLSSDPNFNTQWTFWTAPYAFPDAFHVVALLWDETSATTYVDGLPIVKRGYKWVHDDGSDAGYAHVLLNFALGGQWAGRHGIDNGAFPQALEVDYVRVYQRAGAHDTSVSTTGQDLCPAGGGC
jgi:beta-glucanase (GH16 family)